jgi:methyltransferase (TIGR00027 family)
VRDDRPSTTAAWVAGWRGLGTLIDPAHRLADDPYGLALGGAWARAIARLGPRVLRLPQVANWVGYMQVRTKLIDDALLAFVDGGGVQVVILGAGYDCRAKRFAERLRGARVIEVDHPATQSRKRAVLGNGAAYPAALIEWDFARRPLAELPAALAEHGLDPRAPSLTIWEGVTMYLAEPAIEATFDAARAWGGDGSRIVMSYIDRALLERPRGIVRFGVAAVRALGEPFTFGWHPPALPAWLDARGWRLVVDHDLDRARHAMLPPAIADHVAAYGRHIAIAEPVD